MQDRRDYRGIGPKGWTRTDERIYEDIGEILTHNPYIDASQIEVEVKEGLVTLRGSVEDRPMKLRAEEAIEHITGVRDIRNELSVRRTWMERMIDAAGGEEAHSGNGLIGDLKPESRPHGWPI